MKPPVLTIAGSDCSGGAGIQADLKALSANSVFGMSVLTSITAQNTCGVSSVFHLPSWIIDAQLDAIFSDIPGQNHQNRDAGYTRHHHNGEQTN